MHDPSTVTFEIKYPWRGKPSGLFPNGYRASAITIWHEDPETDHTDDSCGWFIRSRHCDQVKLKKIREAFEFDWDRVFKSDSGHVYFCGLFDPSGNPHFSVHGIVLNLFWIAARIHFDGSWDKASKFINAHLAEILIFAENPSDSLFDGITRKFQDACSEPQTERIRGERIDNMAGCIYSWIMRSERPWYRHPRWHIWHWKFQVHAWQLFKRWAFEKCCKCGKGFRWGECPIGDWHGTRMWHQSCDSNSLCDATDTKQSEG